MSPMSPISPDNAGSPDSAGALRLHADRRRMPDRPRALASEHATLAIPAALDRLAAAEGANASAVLLAAFVALLARYTGQPTIAIATSAAAGAGGTPRLVRFEVAAGTAFGALVSHVAGRLAGPEADAGAEGAPVAFAIAAHAGPHPSGDHELCLRAICGDQPALVVDYDGALFDPTTVRRLLRHYRTLLRAGVQDPQLETDRLPMLSAEEEQLMLVTWNDTRADLPLGGRSLHEAFARRARERPDDVAVVHEDTEITFREVETAAHRLAWRLRRAGVARGQRVGVCLHRSPGFLVAVLAALEAGAAYVPLAPDYPRSRLEAMVRDAGCAVIVTSHDLAASCGTMGAALVLLDGAGESAADGGPLPDAGVGPEDLCYVMYTSGSTGRPKGIALRHGGVLNNLTDLVSRFDIGPGDGVLAVSSLGFDMSVFEFLGVTIVGGKVVVPSRSRAQDPSEWAELIERHRLTVWNSAPSLLELLVARAEHARADLRSLRVALVGGDWIAVSLPDRLRAHAPDLRFISLGGVTEASIHSTVYEVTRTDPEWVSIPYGRPLANQRAYVLDPARQPVPIGVAGELHLAGAGLARGYVGDELTAAKFFAWSHGPVVGERLYRTGDLARYGADGQLELLGRIDFQVKIHGVRIEIGEIEAVVLRHPSVEAAAVTARGDRDSGRQLVAYVVPRAGQRVTAAELRAHAGTFLPGSMVPAAFVVLDQLPQTPNGKVDRGALSARARENGHGEQAGQPDAPRDAWERRVAEAWREVLGSASIGRDSDFFALGGDSFSAMRAAQRIDPTLPVADLFRSPTVKALALRLRERAAHNG